MTKFFFWKYGKYITYQQIFWYNSRGRSRPLTHRLLFCNILFFILLQFSFTSHNKAHSHSLISIYITYLTQMSVSKKGKRVFVVGVGMTSKCLFLIALMATSSLVVAPVFVFQFSLLVKHHSSFTVFILPSLSVFFVKNYLIDFDIRVSQTSEEVESGRARVPRVREGRSAACPRWRLCEVFRRRVCSSG